MGVRAEAFAAFAEAKRTLREITGQVYLAEDAATLARRLKAFFVASRLKILPRAVVRSDVAQPIFIVGFPRSGTTMVEQTLSAHADIAAGDELPVINELTGLIPRMLDSPLTYPDALSELWMGDRLEGLDSLRDYYLQRVRQLGAFREGAAWFTDKMPLNETHLGLIGLIFPQAPILQVVRHPLDVVLSVFSNHLTHGFYCAYDLMSIARHYVLVMDLVEHYRREMDLRIPAGAIRGRDRRPGGARARDARVHRLGLRSALSRFSRKPPLRAHGELRPGDGKALRPLPLPLSRLPRGACAGHPRVGADHPPPGLRDRLTRAFPWLVGQARSARFP